ncbi:uncharacterized protein PHACADRAFT_252218 [Phanerochaete carnosa HHB-10118-sp]|uniref:Uncharacterized protein n=1 Tax=Phanerochaete carnosa (strain HHB-10118-sp) TaxID=650164 RepID=K5W2N5_PHACS|nr:uncharacterized protein PHACADRAFT_252218 [Phanerochaete carnosa HHB-10118-sp]EKM58143.1 hypothetical protein PHACADRAFT_252218 [Phanerochaete carnosa HHB-10118-sp]
MTLSLVCDTLLVCRVFVICDRKYYAVALPSILLLVDTVLSAWYIWTLSQIGLVRPLKGVVVTRINYVYVVTLALNLVCTAMISWKIWATRKKLPGPAVAGIGITGVIAVAAESAAIYPFILIAVLVTSLLGTTRLWIIFDPMCPILGIIFSAVMMPTSEDRFSNTFAVGDLSLRTPSQMELSRSKHQRAVAANRRSLPASSRTSVPGRTQSSRELSINSSQDEPLAVSTSDNLTTSQASCQGSEV